jgi:hypothetical protein
MASMQVYDHFVPHFKSGEVYGFKVDQDLKDGKNDLLVLTGPDTVYVNVDGPQLLLTPDDIAGVYPAPGSTTSCDLFPPHIALTRRTLPWERLGPVNSPDVPWLALLLLTADDLVLSGDPVSSDDLKPQSVAVKDIQVTDAIAYDKLANKLKLSPATQVRTLRVHGDRLGKILGKAADQSLLLKRLCHGKQVTDTNGDQFTAIVMANRLPDVSKGARKHLAALVSLEQRDDVWGRLTANETVTLVVVHSWTFTPSAAADFEEVMQAIEILPNGGVLRFGNIPRTIPENARSPAPLSGGFEAVLDPQGYLSGPLDHAKTLETATAGGNVVWRGPLRPFPPPARSPAFAVRSDPTEFQDQGATRLDYSHASAFELGRLLALGDGGIRQDLREVHCYLNLPQKHFVDTPNIPQSLQSPFWGVDPESALQNAIQDPWSLPSSFGAVSSLLGTGDTLIQSVAGDVSGIVAQFGAWQNSFTTLAQAGAAQSAQASVIDIKGVTEAGLEAQFSDVKNAGSIGSKVQGVEH